jgi:glycosyltransferase involved in cell wall biosynthesis
LYLLFSFLNKNYSLNGNLIVSLDSLNKKKTNRSPVKPCRLLSFVIPLYNEELSISMIVQQLDQISKTMELNHEIVFVNDGSSDQTLRTSLALQEGRDDILLVNLSRNFGKEIALLAGLEHASGDLVVTMDGDLQHPVSLIPEMLDAWKSGYDVAVAVRTNRDGESQTKQFATRWFYHIFNSISEIKIPPNSSDFRLMDRRVVDSLISLRESNRFNKGLFAWIGFSTKDIPYIPDERIHGQTGWGIKQLWRFGLNGIFGFSSLPLRLISWLGVFSSLSGFLYGAIIVFNTTLYGRDLPGYASIFAAILLFGGLQLLSLGVIGEYIARIFVESKKRPIYITDNLYRNGKPVEKTDDHL